MNPLDINCPPAAESELQSAGSVASKQIRLKEVFALHEVDWKNFESLGEAGASDEEEKEMSSLFSLMQTEVQRNAQESQICLQVLRCT